MSLFSLCRAFSSTRGLGGVFGQVLFLGLEMLYPFGFTQYWESRRSAQ
jgi:hypothetical protein